MHLSKTDLDQHVNLGMFHMRRKKKMIYCSRVLAFIEMMHNIVELRVQANLAI